MEVTLKVTLTPWGEPARMDANAVADRLAAVTRGVVQIESPAGGSAFARIDGVEVIGVQP